MRKHFHPALAVVVMASALLFACNKTSKEPVAQTNLELASPDKSIKLGSNEGKIIARIKQTTGLKEAEKVTKIEYPKTTKGYFAVVTYEKSNGESATMVFANFQLGLVTTKLVYHDGSENQRIDPPGGTCYAYWCTNSGGCSACQVTVTDPFGSPTLKCTCAECVLHQKKEPCPPNP